MRSCESYAHRLAKDVFAGWLSDLAREAIDREYEADGMSDSPLAEIGYLAWRVNRDQPPYGIWTEYPFGPKLYYPWGGLYRDGFETVWDEASERWRSRPPTYDELCALGRHPEFIADVAVQHKGHITTVAEIVHKNPPSEAKIAAFHEMGVDLLIIPAKWILGQVQRPSDIPDEFWAWGPS